MKVAGFSFIKNAELLEFPIVEAIKSILPICDVVYVAVGDSLDNTRVLVEGIDDNKIRIIDTVWDKNVNKKGTVLAQETDKAFQAVGEEFDWCFYIQGDEVFHEDGINSARSEMERYQHDHSVDGLLLKFLHFYGSYDYVAASADWYKNEVRIIKNDKRIFSYRDAQGFRKLPNNKLRVKPIDATVHHYGWVRSPKTMNAKINNCKFIWGGEEYNGERFIEVFDGKAFDYSHISSVAKFNGNHPEVMKNLIAQKNWKFDHDLSKNSSTLKNRFKDLVERLTGLRPFDYKNYIIV